MIAFLQRWKSRLAPFETSLLESFLIRVGIALAVWTVFPMQSYPGEPQPNGLARLIPGDNNFTWFHADAAQQVCQYLMGGALVLYVAHRFAWLAYPIIIGLLVISGTLTNSQALEVTHHSQILTLVILGQGAWYFIEWRQRGRARPDFASRLRWHAMAFFFSMQIIMAGYMVSVVSKMVYSDGKWISKAANIPVQLEKNQLMDYYNEVNLPDSDRPAKDKGKKMGWFEKIDLPAQTQSMFIGHPNVARLAMTTGMLLEFFCFLALLGRRTALFYGILLIGFHLVISWTMNLTFRYHISLLSLYFVAVPYWLTCRLPAAWRNPRWLAA